MDRTPGWMLLAALTLASSTYSYALETVTISELGNFGDAPVYIAIEKGYFRDHGIEAKLLKFASATETTAALSTGELQVSGGNISAGLFNAFARGWPVRIAASRLRDVAGYSNNTVAVRSDLKDQIRSMADLKGRKVAINAPAGGLSYMLGIMLEAEKLSLKDVDVVYMSWPNMAPAFDKKAIDAGMMVEPFVAQFQERGQAFPFRRAADHFKGRPFEISVLLVNKDWVDRNMKVASEFAVAYFMGARYYYEALMGGKNRSEVIEILARRTRVTDKSLFDKMPWGYMDPNGQLVRDSLRDQQDWHARQGSIPRKVNIDDIVDDRLVKNALSQLGVMAERRP